MVRRRWVLRKHSPEHRALAEDLAVSAGLPPFAALLALSRGLEEDELPAFLGLEECFFSNPYDLPDMELAVERIERAIALGEHITVFGDYDADGVSATALLYSYLRTRSEALSYYLPDRHKEGYGLNMEAIDALGERGAKLIVTVDNGVSAVREIERAKALGIDVVITDHHQMGKRLPEAFALVNPHRADCELPFRDYAGVGVAFLLVCALEGCEPEELLPAYAPLLAIGTAADVVPLLGENRAFVRAGIDWINEARDAEPDQAPGLGLVALLRAARAKDRPLSSTGLSFIIAPRVNAAGRMGGAEAALELLLTGDPAQAERLAQRLELWNEERQGMEQEIAAQAAAWLESHPERQHDRVMVFAGEGWHEGVIGIVASRMLEKLGKPCLMISVHGGIAKGSGRSLPGFHLFEAVSNSAPLMQKFGGHEQAAGFTLASQDLDRFRAEINEYASLMEMPFPEQALDAVLDPARLEPGLVDEMDCLEPFGAGNSLPVFALRGMRLAAAAPVGNGGRHLRLTLEQGDTRVTAMLFRVTREEFAFEQGDILDLAVSLEINEYMGRRGVTVIVRNLKHHALPNDALLRAQRLVEAVLRGDALPREQAAACLPGRETIAQVYRAFGQKSPLTPESLLLALHAQTAEELDIARVWLAAETLLDLDLIAADAAGGMTRREARQKVNLEDSVLLKRLTSLAKGEA